MVDPQKNIAGNGGLAYCCESLDDLDTTSEHPDEGYGDDSAET